MSSFVTLCHHLSAFVIVCHHLSLFVTALFYGCFTNCFVCHSQSAWLSKDDAEISNDEAGFSRTFTILSPMPIGESAVDHCLKLALS
jgi:hypothetical protein